MDGMDRLYWFGGGLLLVVALYGLRAALGLWAAARIRRAWRRLAGAEGLEMASTGLRAPPRLEGIFRSRRVLVEGTDEQGSPGRVSTRVEVRLGGPSPLRLRIRREGPLALLGGLVRAGFRPGRVEASDAIEMEGDRSVVGDLLGAGLGELLRSLEEWRLEIVEDRAALERPGLVSSPQRLLADLGLLSDLADRLEKTA